MNFIYLLNNGDNSGSESTAWATFIGIVICLCGNVIISFALNLQRLAHERIQRKIAVSRSAQEQNSPAENYGTRTSSTTVKQDDREDDDHGTQYLHSPLWWTGLVLMVIGESGNFIACEM